MTFRHLLTATAILAAAFTAAGQNDGAVRNYRFAVESNPYLYLSNPAFLDTFNERIALVELDGRKDDGGLYSLSESPNSFQVGAETESFFRLSDRITFYGGLSWYYFSGKEMGGQILMDPDYNPVNFLENSELTKGVKNREHYQLAGAMSYRLGKQWAAGVRIDYTSADQTKIKDPRFSNIWMDINVHAGVSFAPGKWIIGLSGEYRNTLEQLRGGVYGTTDKQYYVGTDKGGFWGTVAELSGDLNPVPTTMPFCMNNSFYGGAIQVAWNGLFSTEFWGLKRTGFYGRKSSTTPVFFEFDGLSAGFNGKLTLPAGKSQHVVTLDASMESVTNRENKFQYVTPSGQNTIVDYKSKDTIHKRMTVGGNLGYVWHYDIGNYGPDLSIGINLNGRMKDQTTTLFPFSRKNDVTTLAADIFGIKNISIRKSLLTVELHALAGGGFGTPKKDDASASAASSNLKSFDSYLYRQFEFDTAMRAGGEIGLTYTLFVWKKLVPYVKISDRYITLLSAPEYLSGASRNAALVSIGCNF